MKASFANYATEYKSYGIIPSGSIFIVKDNGDAF